MVHPGKLKISFNAVKLSFHEQ